MLKITRFTRLDQTIKLLKRLGYAFRGKTRKVIKFSFVVTNFGLRIKARIFGENTQCNIFYGII